jgi:Putative DNA-binding domain
MSYSKLYFNKELAELVYEDIETFFKEEKSESDKIEFKSYVETHGKNDTEKENTIIKAICALLNSEGGLIIWGAPVGKVIDTETKMKVFGGQLSPVTKLIEKDSFINRITDLITPSPRGIEFVPLQNGNNYVYILDIERSNYSPHQFRNNYFMRLDGQTVYAPHHYIEALFKKVTYPRLEGYIKIERANIVPYMHDSNKKRMVISFSFYIFNKSKLQNEHDINCRILIDEGFFLGHDHYVGNNKRYPSGKELILDSAKGTLFYGEPFYHSESIELPLDLISSTKQLRLYFFFGGKASPLMASQYLISLKSIPDDEDYNSMFGLIEENKYLHEIGDEKKLDEKGKLKLLLGR